MRSTRPSQYKFLLGAVFAVMAFIGMLIFEHVDATLCAVFQRGHEATCSVLPEPFYLALCIIMVMGPLHSAYRFYRDFHKGEYYERLAEAGYL